MSSIPSPVLDKEKVAAHEHVRTIVDAEGGDAVLVRNHAALESLLAERAEMVLIPSSEGAIDQTYRSLIESLH